MSNWEIFSKIMIFLLDGIAWVGGMMFATLFIIAMINGSLVVEF